MIKYQINPNTPECDALFMTFTVYPVHVEANLMLCLKAFLRFSTLYVFLFLRFSSDSDRL